MKKSIITIAAIGMITTCLYASDEEFSTDRHLPVATHSAHRAQIRSDNVEWDDAENLTLTGSESYLGGIIRCQDLVIKGDMFVLEGDCWVKRITFDVKHAFLRGRLFVRDSITRKQNVDLKVEREGVLNVGGWTSLIKDDVTYTREGVLSGIRVDLRVEPLRLTSLVETQSSGG